jgi:hypothetical protein
MEFCGGLIEPSLIAVSDGMFDRLLRLFEDLNPWVFTPGRAVTSAHARHLKEKRALALCFNGALIRPFRFMADGEFFFVGGYQLLGVRSL